MFIQLSVTGSISAANLSTALGIFFRNCKSVNSVANILALPNMPTAFTSMINPNASTFIKGNALTCTIEEVDATNTDIIQPIMNSSRVKRTRCVHSSTFRFQIFDGINQSALSDVSTAVSVNQNIVLSMSDRHICLVTGQAIIGMFEFVANDGYYTATSRFLPYCVTTTTWHGLNVSSVPMSAAGIMYASTGVSYAPANSQMQFETPFAATAYTPEINGGYDYIGSATEKAPVMVPFGAHRKPSGIIGGSISELCDIYMGPTNIAGAFETISMGDMDYLCVPGNYCMFYIPKR